ncbi:MAG: alpha/beta fold hydrolase [Ignavibacteria bacterium]
MKYKTLNLSLTLLSVLFLQVLVFSQSKIYHSEIKAGIFQYNVVKTDFQFLLRDSVFLDCTKFYPDATFNGGSLPAVIFCHGFGFSKDENLKEAENLASAGFFTLCYSMRGQGKSGGYSHLISAVEMNDFVQIVTLVKNDTLVNKELVASIGASQGGIIPIMAACYFPGLLRCIISQVASPDFASDWIYNNSIKMSLLWSLSYDSSTVRYSTRMRKFRDWILSGNPDNFDSLARYLLPGRDFSPYLKNNKTPLLIYNIWQDKFFSVNGWLKTVSQLSTPYLLYAGTFPAHGGEYSQNEQNLMLQLTNQWIEYWLLGKDNGIIDSNTFHFSTSRYPRINFAWTWEHSSLRTPTEFQTDSLKLYPGGGKKLFTIMPQNKDSFIFVNDVRDTNLSMREAVNYEFWGPAFNSKFGKTELVFESDSLTSDLRIIGIPSINLVFRSNASEVQFNFQVYESQPGTTPYLISRANYTARKVKPGLMYLISFPGVAFSHIFKAGSKIRIVLTNLDNTEYDSFLKTNPFVLPSLKRSITKIYFGKGNPTYIALPILQ